MSKFTKSIERTFLFDGDTILVRLTRLKRKDALKLTPFMQQDEDGNVQMDLTANLKLMDVAAEMLPSYIKFMNGLVIEGEELTIKEGKPSNLELAATFIEDAYFLNLVSEIVGFLIEKSFVSGDELKKSDAPQENTLKDSQTPNDLKSEA